MNVFTKSKIGVLMVATLFLFTVVACEKNPTEPEGKEAPSLPPIQSMQLDLSFFSGTSNASLGKIALSKNNFTAATLRVVIINTVVILAAVVPTAVFVAAISQQPELQNDGKFHWIYTVQHGLNIFSVDLAGWVDVESSEVVWEVYVTSNTHSPQLDHFLWYQGRSRIDNTEGWWLFHDDKSPDSLLDVLRIDWQIPDENQSELIFTNINQSDEGYGDSLKYSVNDYNNYLIFYDASGNKTNTIYWNSQTGAGYIEWFDYNEGMRSYWDENQNDIPGPPA